MGTFQGEASGRLSPSFPLRPAPSSTREQVATSLPGFALRAHSHPGDIYTPDESEMFFFKSMLTLVFSESQLLNSHWHAIGRRGGSSLF